jgi:MazG family protein
MAKHKQISRLVDVVHQLRRKCPWDRKQTHKSLAPYLLEEAYETVDAISTRDPDLLREELGDLLLQVVLHSELAAERGDFTFEDVAEGIAEKMIRRHPHVFGDARAGDEKEHQRNWTRLKSKEKPKRFLLEGTPRAMPALQLAQRYGEIAASVGFDWKGAEEVLEKVEDELHELKVELRRRKLRREAVELELGDLLFTLSHLARHLRLNAETSLKASAAKFADRFTRLEKAFRKREQNLSDSSAEELDAEWNRIKSL